MDLLGELVRLGGVRGTAGASIDAGADWGWWIPESDRAAFHTVTEGTAWIALPGGEIRELAAGDVVLLPGGAAHATGSDPAAVRRTGPDRFDPYRAMAPGNVAIGEGPVQTHVLCAHFEHHRGAPLPMLEGLPPVVFVAAGTDPALDATIQLLASELGHPQLASELLLDHLTGALLIQTLRAWIGSADASTDAPWLRGLRDPVVREALVTMHEAPSELWTADQLAVQVAVSPATLARRFHAAIGMTPAAYLTRLRLDLAAHRLRETSDSLEQIAQDVGYTSVHAFSRAFKRRWDRAPGGFRLAAA